MTILILFTKAATSKRVHNKSLIEQSCFNDERSKQSIKSIGRKISEKVSERISNTVPISYTFNAGRWYLELTMSMKNLLNTY